MREFGHISVFTGEIDETLLWRTLPPTPSQIRFAKKRGIPFPEDATRGWMHDAIGDFLAFPAKAVKP